MGMEAFGFLVAQVIISHGTGELKSCNSYWIIMIISKQALYVYINLVHINVNYESCDCMLINMSSLVLLICG